MAEIAYSQSRTANGDTLVAWTGVTEADTFQPIPFDRIVGSHIVQFDGNFGTGGSVQLEGSLDGTIYSVLNDDQGSPIVTTAAAVRECVVKPLVVRPRITAGTGVVLRAFLLIRK